MTQEPSMPPAIQTVRGVLSVNETIGKTDRKGGKYDFLTLKVGSVSVNVFSYDKKKYEEVKEDALQLSGSPAILEYTQVGQYPDFISLALDPNPPEQAVANAKTDAEVMTKADWEAKDRKRWRVECLRIAANIKTLDPAIPEEFVAMAREFEKYVYGNIVEAPLQPPFISGLVGAPKEMSKLEFVAIATSMGFEDNKAIREGLGLEKGQIWKETRELALDKLFLESRMEGKLTLYKSWRDLRNRGVKASNGIGDTIG